MKEKVKNSSKSNDIFKLIINIICIILFVCEFFSIVLYAYFRTLGKDLVPTAIVSSYVTTVKDPLSEEEKPFMEVNYYEHLNNNDSNGEHTAYEVIELKINSYSGTDKQAIYSKGYQMINYKSIVLGIYTYDSYDGVSFYSGKQLGNDYICNDTFITDIDNETYAVKLNGEYTAYETNVGKTIWWAISGLFVGWEENKTERTKNEYTKNYTMEDFLKYLAVMIKSSSNGTGKSTIPLADLGKYFSVYKEEDGQFKTKVSFNSENNAYFTIDTYYDKRGMSSYRQSLFKSVACDSSFNLTGVIEDADYWNDTTTINLNNNHFTKREVAEEIYISLNLNIVQKISNLQNIEIEIIIDVTNLDGFDYYALCGLDNIANITLKSDIQKDFKLLNASLKDTDYDISEIKLLNVNLINLEVS